MEKGERLLFPWAETGQAQLLADLSMGWQPIAEAGSTSMAAGGGGWANLAMTGGEVVTDDG
jgi:hypothetical protein